MKRNSKKRYSMFLVMLVLAIGMIAGAYALLSDTVTLTGTATVAEADNVAFEITSITLDSSASTINENFAPTYNLAEDKKTATFSLGEIQEDENFYAAYTVVVTNKGNVPVTLKSSTVNNKLETTIDNNGYEIDETGESGGEMGQTELNEVLAPGETCTFFIDVRPEEGATFTAGDEITSTISITGTQYTGSETPLQSHTHIPGMGGL